MKPEILDNELAEVISCEECMKSPALLYEDSNMCEDCYYEKHRECCNCGEMNHVDYAIFSYRDDWYCEDCYYEYHYICNSCGDSVHSDDSHWVQDESYCYGCVPDEDDLVDFIENKRPPSNSRVGSSLNSKMPNRLVGLEAECIIPNHTSSRTPKHWGTTYDGSINAEEDYEGIELVMIPASGDLLEEQIEELGVWCDDYEAKVNVSCGFHVHFDSTNLTAREVAHIGIVYRRAEYILKSIMPPSRQKSRWCKDFDIPLNQLRSVRAEEDLIETYYTYLDAQPSTEKYNEARYCGLNIHSRYFHGSIEFRLHSGTLNKTKIKNWIRILSHIVEEGIMLSKLSKEGYTDWKLHLDNLGLDGRIRQLVKEEELFVYVKKREQQVKPN